MIVPVHGDDYSKDLLMTGISIDFLSFT